MPSIRVAVTLATGATNTNILIGVPGGTRFEILQSRALVRVYAACIGPAVEGEILTSISLTNVVLMDNGAVPIAAAGLSRQSHLLVSELGSPQDRLLISVTNNDAATNVPVFLIDVVPR